VITAMLGAARAASAVRFSLGEDSSRDDVDRAVAALTRIVARR
jgi:cysteine desulfurase